VKVGQIVKVNDGEIIPCDLVLLTTLDREGICFIQTDSLDGLYL